MFHSSLLTHICKTHCFVEDTLYDFEVNTRQSEIGGSGAFLVFRGSRKLKPKRKLNGRREWRVKLTGDNLHCDSEKKALIGVCPERVGFLGAQIEADYISSPSTDFFFPNASINLGTYGPLRQEGTCQENK